MQPEVQGKVNDIIARIQKDKEALTAKAIQEVSNPQYVELLELDDRVRVHAELETFPKKLIKSKAPNQTDAELEYIEASYQPETLALWGMAMNNTNRIFNPQNFSINWKDEENAKEKTEDYFDKDYPNYKSLISYFDSIVRPKKINYPNSVLTVKPSRIPLKEKIEGEQKVYKIDSTKRIEPVAVVYDTAQVIYYEAGEGCIILLNEKSTITDFNGKPKNTGLIFEVYDKNSIYRVEQYGKDTDWSFTDILYYEHGYNKLPCWQLGGQKKAKENSFIHVSHFYEAVPSLNQVVFDSCMLNTSKAANVYLEKYEHVSKCSNEQCSYGKVPDITSDDLMATTTCPNCKGTGNEPRNGVLGVYQITIPERFDPPYQVPSPPAGYIEKNASILEFLRTEIEKNEAKSFRFLGLDVSDSEVKGGETALGKMIDKEALEASIRVIAMELFDLLKNAIDAIGFMRYRDAFKAPTINPPTTFAIRTYQSIADEMKTLQDAPEIVKRAMNLEFMKSRFSASSELTTTYNLIASADVLQNKAEVDINAAIATGRIAKWRGILHDNIHRYIDKAISKDAKFQEKDLETKIAILEKMAKDEMQAEFGSPMNADSILAGMAGDGNTPIDIEAEAKAKLKGTVGGVQGILEIQKSVSEGLTDRSAAIALMVEIYGFTPELADKMLGTPVKKVADTAPKVVV